MLENLKVQGISALNKDEIWISTSDGLRYYDRIENTTYTFNKGAGLTSQTPTANCLTKLYGRVIFGTVNGIAYVKNEEILSRKTNPVIIRGLETDEGLLSLDKSVTIFKGDYLSVKVSSINYPIEKVVYQYAIDEQPWQEATTGNVLTFLKLKADQHQLLFRAKAEGGHQWSVPVVLAVTTVPYWYMTWWMLMVYVLSFILLMVFSAKWNTRRLKHNQIVLEAIIAKRTTELRRKNIEIEGQNEELQQQSEEIAAQRDALANQHHELQESFETINSKNELITSSIKAANTIQKAILPKEKKFEGVFAAQFIIYHPKDIVSGDFYWFAETNGFHTVALIDCTGHGVPGAFMSMIANTILNAIVKENGESSPEVILDRLNQKVIKALDQKDTKNNSHGMDAAILTLQYRADLNAYTYQFSGAKNALFYQQAGESMINSIKGSRSSIGGVYNIDAVFQLHEGTLQKGDKIFLTSDGVIDMLTPENKKFGSTKFRKFIEDHHHQTITELGYQFETFIQSSKQAYPLRDDVTLIGGVLR